MEEKHMTLGQLKSHVAAMRKAKAKLTRKAKTLQKLREEAFKLGEECYALDTEILRLTNVFYPYTEESKGTFQTMSL